ncbi:MAG: PEP-CTERM sorting domain-containing protein [Myxococcota bacterium]|nr:PEP-CTERM sorting domain-containing protein [Myxococcota bacterium]
MMLRKLAGLISIAAVCTLLAGSSSAAVLIPGGSSFKVNLAALPTIELKGGYGAGAGATLTNGSGSGHDISTGGGLFQGTGITAGTSMLTGVALLVNMTMTATNVSAAYTSAFGPTANPWGGNLATTNPNYTAASGTICASGCLGGGGVGGGAYNGQVVLSTTVGSVAFPLSTIGVGGTDTVTIAGQPLVATGGPWVTGKVQVTGITTNVISVPARGGATGVAVEMFLTAAEQADSKVLSTMGGFTSTGTGLNLTRHTVNFGGTQNLASTAVGGAVTMISPLRVNTGILGQGIIPGVWRQTFKFVPEPGTVLLLVSGAAGLVALGRKRMKS